MLLAIFDTTLRDPDDGIVISQALVDEDGGAEKYAKYGYGWGASIDEECIRPFIASFSDLSPKATKEGGVVPLIAQGQAAASISTPHHVTAPFVSVNGTLAIQPTKFTEVLVHVKGSCEVTVDGDALHQELGREHV